jgi:phage recombination protein Bet
MEPILEINLDLIKALNKDATPSEINQLVYLAKQYNLDPLKKEIYCLKFAGKPAAFLVSRDGFLTIANREPNFDGMESDVIYDGDVLLRRGDGSIEIKYGENHFKFQKNQIKGAFCNVYRKDRSKATSMIAPLVDYNKPNNMWSGFTSAMIMKVAESMAIKRSFALSGINSTEEVDPDPTGEEGMAGAIQAPKVVPPELDEKYPKLTIEQVDHIRSVLKDRKELEDEFLGKCTNKYRLVDKEYPKLSKIEEVKREDYKAGLKWIEDNIKAMNN